MNKHHDEQQGLAIAAAMAGGLYLLWRHKQLTTGGAGIDPATGAVVGPDGLTPIAPLNEASGSGVVDSSGGLTSVLLPSVPLNSGPFVVGSAGGNTIVEENTIHTPYGNVLPLIGNVFPDPLTGKEPNVVIVPQVQTPTVTTIPTNTPAVQAAVDVCAGGVSFTNNNPTGANNGTYYPSLHAGMVAAFKELKYIYNAYGQNSFTISGIANYWVNVVHDGLAWGTTTGSTQVGFENSMVGLTGYGDYNVEGSDKATMIRLMRGIVGTIAGPQYFGTISEACMSAAFDEA